MAATAAWCDWKELGFWVKERVSSVLKEGGGVYGPLGGCSEFKVQSCLRSLRFGRPRMGASFHQGLVEAESHRWIP